MAGKPQDADGPITDQVTQDPQGQFQNRWTNAWENQLEPNLLYLIKLNSGMYHRPIIKS